jgi:hypothetical protein
MTGPAVCAKRASHSPTSTPPADAALVCARIGPVRVVRAQRPDQGSAAASSVSPQDQHEDHDDQDENEHTTADDHGSLLGRSPLQPSAAVPTRLCKETTPERFAVRQRVWTRPLSAVGARYLTAPALESRPRAREAPGRHSHTAGPLRSRSPDRRSRRIEVDSPSRDVSPTLRPGFTAGYRCFSDVPAVPMFQRTLGGYMHRRTCSGERAGST